MPEDYYALLGVAPDASEETILRAYRRKAAEHHPDVSDEPGASETFRRLNRAKQVLTGQDRRRAYDRLGHDRYLGRQEDDVKGPSWPGRRSPTADPGDAGWSWPAGVDTVLEALFGPVAGGRQTSASASHWSPGPGWAGTSPAFSVDLEALFERLREQRAGRPGPRTTSRQPPDDRRRHECPKCRGRGTFVHVIDTARGRTRQIEPCEQCDGTGTVPA